MDIERLMIDLHVDQLQNIHANLTVEMEEKKEELRQMVGRRYRDVLDASSAVRHVTEIANSLSSAVHEAKAALVESPSEKPVVVSNSPLLRFMIFHRLLPLAFEGDPVSKVFAINLVESIYLNLSTMPLIPERLCAVLPSMSKKIIRMRLRLEKLLEEELNSISSFDENVHLLTAIGILKHLSPEQLLDIFIEKKKLFLEDKRTDSFSLMDDIWYFYNVIGCISHLFVDGALLNALRTSCSRGWILKKLEIFILNEPLMVQRQVHREIEGMPDLYDASLIKSLNEDSVSKRCSDYLLHVTVWFRSVVYHHCSLLENTTSAISFISVVRKAFKKDWPVVGNSNTIYRNLFGNIVIERFEVLVSEELLSLEKFLFDQLSLITCHPSPLFKKRPPKFDALLATGVSAPLLELVSNFDANLKNLFDFVKKYESIGMEEATASFSSKFSAAVKDMLKRICVVTDELENVTPLKSRANRSLSFGRLYVALLQQKDSAFYICMFKNSDTLSECANFLHKAADKAFCVFVDCILDTCLEESQISFLSNSISDPFLFLSALQNFESSELSDVGTIEVPMHLNYFVHDFLHSVFSQLSQHSIVHLFSREVRNHIADRLSDVLSNAYREAASTNPTLLSHVACQCLFDVRVLNAMFPREHLRSLISLFESKMDPFDLSLLAAPLAKNIRTAMQRYSILFGYLLLDPIGNTDAPLSSSYMAVVDIAPRITDILRFSLIPRLSSGTEHEAELRPTYSASNVVANRNVSSNVVTSMRSTPSLTSFYKMSTGWFGGS